MACAAGSCSRVVCLEQMSSLHATCETTMTESPLTASAILHCLILKPFTPSSAGLIFQKNVMDTAVLSFHLLTEAVTCCDSCCFSAFLASGCTILIIWIIIWIIHLLQDGDFNNLKKSSHLLFHLLRLQ